MKVIELFSGLGATSMALKKIGIPYQVIGISEIDTNVTEMYTKIHGKVKNFGDITKIKELPDCNFNNYKESQDLGLDFFLFM